MGRKTPQSSEGLHRAGIRLGMTFPLYLERDETTADARRREWDLTQPQLSIWNFSSLQPVGKRISGVTPAAPSCCLPRAFPALLQLGGPDRDQDRDLGSISGIRVIQGDADGCWNSSPGPRCS